MTATPPRALTLPCSRLLTLAAQPLMKHLVSLRPAGRGARPGATYAGGDEADPKVIVLGGLAAAAAAVAVYSDGLSEILSQGMAAAA